MFGKKRAEEIALLIKSAEEDRALYAKEAASDREMFITQANRDREVFLEFLTETQSANETGSNSTGVEPAVKAGQEEKAAYALNLCTVSISQIIDYNDLIIMEQEYDAILNNLNLENFPKDEALLKILKQILDVVAFFRIQAGEKKLQEEEYKKKVKDAIWSAIPNPSTIIAGGSAGLVGLAVTTAMAVGTGYMNYRKARANIDIEQHRKEWELQRAAMEQFDGLRRELFDTAWRLAEIYGFNDGLRLTARQIDQYNHILEDPDALRRYERLEYISSKFKAYPPFWYYLGHAAYEVYIDDKNSEELRLEYKKNAIDAYTTFLVSVDDEAHNNLLREDHTCAACALEKFALIANDSNVTQDDKIRLLQIAAKNAGNAFDTLQLCVTGYLSIGETNLAVKLMRMLVNEGYNGSLNAQLLSMQYVFDYLKGSTESQSLYSTLAKRVDESVPLFPMPKNYDDKNLLVGNFMREQYKYIFDEYKSTVSDYIIQCAVTYNKILSMPGDISEEIIGFIQGIVSDIEDLFNGVIAEQMQGEIKEKLNEVMRNPSNKNVFTEQINRTQNEDLSFENVFKDAFLYLADAIKYNIEQIKTAPDEEKMKKVSEYAGQILIFKNKKSIYGTAISKTEVAEEKDPYAVLRNASRDNTLLQNCKRVVEDFLCENDLFVIGRKKESAKFYTTKESAELSNYLASKNGMPPRSEVIGVLDTKKRDLVFTTKGILVPRTFHSMQETIKYANIEMVGGDIVIGKIKFADSEVNNSALEELINALALKTSKVDDNDCLKAFEEKMGKCYLV